MQQPAEQNWAEAFQSTMLDESGPSPLYNQIYVLLREQIRRGRLEAGTVLPGELELAGLFGVSRITMKRALKELADDGLVVRQRGRGTMVSEGGAIPVVSSSFENLFESLQAMGLETQVDLLDVCDLAADPVVAHRLQLKPGAPVQRSIRRRSLGEEPFSYLVAYVPAEIAAKYDVRALASMPLLKLLEVAGHSASEAEQWITAVAAPPHVAAALQIQAGSPILKIDRVMAGARARPFQFIQGYYHPDRFQYHIDTRRRRGASGSDDV